MELPTKQCPNCQGAGQVAHTSKLGSWRSSGVAKCRRCGGSGTIPYSLPDLREIAAGAVRCQLRKYGEPTPALYEVEAAWGVLDDIAQSDPETLAAWFYRNAPEPQVKLWFRDWRRMARRAKESGNYSLG